MAAVPPGSAASLSSSRTATSSFRSPQTAERSTRSARPTEARPGVGARSSPAWTSTASPATCGPSRSRRPRSPGTAGSTSPGRIAGSGLAARRTTSSTAARMDGLTWSAVTRIPIDPTNSDIDHFLPGIAVDKSTSGSTTHLAVGYYYFPVSNCTDDHVRAHLRLRVVDRRRGYLDDRESGHRADEGHLDREHQSGAHGRRLHLDLVHRRRQGASGLLLGKASRQQIASCSHTTACRQRLSTASFDITAPPLTPRRKSETGPVYPRIKPKRPARLVTAN